MRNNIIVYTNIYDTDVNVARYAVEFAKSIDAHITFCDTITAETPKHAIVQPIHGHAGEMPVYSHRIAKMEETVHEELQNLCKQLSTDWAHIDYEVLTDVNYIDALKKLVKEKQAKYVLISKTQSPNFWDKWLGTVSTTIAEELDVPTILIPRNQHYEPFTHILHQIELNEADLSKLKKTLILARQLNTKVTAAYFDNNDPISDEMFKKQTSSLAETVQHPMLSFKHYKIDDLSETLNTLVQKSSIDMIALRHHQEGLLNRIFSNDHTDKIILDNDIPFIVY